MYGSRLEVKRFEDRIVKHEAYPVEEGKILFYGHSLFTRCSNITNFKQNPMIEECVRMKDGTKAVINHAFGTSSADDLLYYYYRMVKPYKPRALVLATMDNDTGFGYSAKDVMEILARIVHWAKADFPGIKVYCFSAGVSVKHKDAVNIYTRKRDEFNQYLKLFCEHTEDCTYVPFNEAAFLYEDAADIGDYNKIREDIFMPDQNHFNPEGYAMFMDYIKVLLDDLL
ncbi:MAG: hypothetical protein IKA47_03575 [Oscillospiraceae bacterium]|nr:hypothetical protein [Oscillospiraceae bacterium]